MLNVWDAKNNHFSFLKLRLLAKGVVSLEKLITSGSLKYQVDLVDSFNNKIESVKHIFCALNVLFRYLKFFEWFHKKSKLILNLEYRIPTSPSLAPKAAPLSK